MCLLAHLLDEFSLVFKSMVQAIAVAVVLTLKLPLTLLVLLLVSDKYK
jgi:hypothetical protein